MTLEELNKKLISMGFKVEVAEYIKLVQQLIIVLKQLPISKNRKITLDILEKFLEYLKGKDVQNPTKDELKILVDTLKELKQNNAQSIQEYNYFENLAEYLKNLIEYGYKPQGKQNEQ